MSLPAGTSLEPPRSSRRRRAGLLLVSLVSSVALAELATRVVLPRPGFEPLPKDQAIVRHPTRGYAYAPRDSAGVNSWGLRGDAIAPGDKIDILAVGDSFTVGGGVNRSEAWPSRLEARANDDALLAQPVRVLNAGVSGYGMRQIRLLTEELAEALHPPIIIVGVLTSRYWRLHDPYVFFHGVAVRSSEIERIKVVADGMIRTAFMDPPWRSIDFFLAEHCYVCAYALTTAHDAVDRASQSSTDDPAGPSRSDIAWRLQPLLEEIRQIKDVSAASRSELVVLLINEQSENAAFAPIERLYNDVVTAFCASLGVRVVNPLPLLESTAHGTPIYRLGSDHHWSAQAHDVVASALLRALKADGQLIDALEPASGFNPLRHRD